MRMTLTVNIDNLFKIQDAHIKVNGAELVLLRNALELYEADAENKRSDRRVAGRMASTINQAIHNAVKQKEGEGYEIPNAQ